MNRFTVLFFLLTCRVTIPQITTTIHSVLIFYRNNLIILLSKHEEPMCHSYLTFLLNINTSIILFEELFFSIFKDFTIIPILKAKLKSFTPRD